MKRITLFAGHYGSGKTALALSYARELKRENPKARVAIADLDIVNPYFRTKDAAEALRSEGVELVVSEYANSNVDFPALPSETYELIANRSVKVVIDVGGDDRGALALGRYAPDILAENDFEMLAVVNASRPLTRTPEETVEVLREIEASSSGLKFTGVVNNTNLGQETKAETIRASVGYAERVAELMGLKVVFTSVAENLKAELGDVENARPMELMPLYYQLRK